MVQTSSLLMRILDRVEARLAARKAKAPGGTIRASAAPLR
jgi:hypothetical protein